MRRIIPLLALFFWLLPAPLRAADEAASLYQVADIAVDETAESAATARTRAVIKAQRIGFEQLLTRLGAESSLAGKLNDDNIATMVQAFEVQHERTSSVRYLGTLTVQFKPAAVRDFLNKGDIPFSEARSRPVLVLPVLKIPSRQIMWEDTTKWRTAWEEAARGSSIVPLIVPTGDLDDIAVLSTAEALEGKSAGLQAMMKKYNANSAIVAILKSDLDKPDPAKHKSFVIEVTRYNASGSPENPLFVTPPMPKDASTAKTALTEAVRQIRTELEQGWKQSAKDIQGAATFLPVDVPIASIAAWSGIRTKLQEIPLVAAVNVISLTRGKAHIDLGFHGDVDALQEELSKVDLFLERDDINGGWVLRKIVVDTP